MGTFPAKNVPLKENQKILSYINYSNTWENKLFNSPFYLKIIKSSISMYLRQPEPPLWNQYNICTKSGKLS